jgi:hypothetical protein
MTTFIIQVTRDEDRWVARGLDIEAIGDRPSDAVSSWVAKVKYVAELVHIQV